MRLVCVAVVLLARVYGAYEGDDASGPTPYSADPSQPFTYYSMTQKDELWGDSLLTKLQYKGPVVHVARTSLLLKVGDTSVEGAVCKSNCRPYIGIRPWLSGLRNSAAIFLDLPLRHGCGIESNAFPFAYPLPCHVIERFRTRPNCNLRSIRACRLGRAPRSPTAKSPFLPGHLAPSGQGCPSRKASKLANSCLVISLSWPGLSWPGYCVWGAGVPGEGGTA